MIRCNAKKAKKKHQWRERGWQRDLLLILIEDKYTLRSNWLPWICIQMLIGQGFVVGIFALFHQTEPQVTKTITSTIILTGKHTCDLIHNYSGHKIRFDLILYGKNSYLLCIIKQFRFVAKTKVLYAAWKPGKTIRLSQKLPFKKWRSTKKGRKNVQNRQRKTIHANEVLKRIVKLLQFPNLFANTATYSLPFDTSMPLSLRHLNRLLARFFFSVIFLSSFSSLAFHLLFHNVVIILTSSNYNLLIFVLTHFARNP